MARGPLRKSAAERAMDAQWEGLRMPNAGSLGQTPASLAIDLRYARLRIWDRWNYERFIRLAKFLNLTLPELASLACIPHKHLQTLEKTNRLMAGTAKNYAGAMVLTLLEAHVCGKYTKDIVENPFVDLNELPGQAGKDSPSMATARGVSSI